MKTERNIDTLLEVLTNGIRLVEEQMKKKEYSKSLLDYIQVTDRKSRQFLYRGGITPTNNEEIDGKQLILLECIQYIMQLFPTYYQEVKDRLDVATMAENSFKSDRIKKVESILDEMNAQIFNNSNIQQWQKVLNNEILSDPIRIKAGVFLKDFVHFWDNFKNHVGIKINDKTISEMYAFRLGGKNIERAQFVNARSDYKKNGVNETFTKNILR